jgi:cytochrome c oxidase subunit 2
MGVFSIFPPRAATSSIQVDALYMFLLAVSGVMTVLIFFFVVFFAFKYRRKKGDPMPRAIHGSLPLEIAWSVIPLMIMMIMFAWGTKLYFEYYTPPKETLDVYVTGKQWMWKVQYPDGQREINELHVPTGRPVKLILASEDVIHSFYIPAFRLKHDVVPGSYQTYWFEATKPGRYHIFCAEYCGTNHSRMTGWVTVMDPVAYGNWLAGSATGSMAEQGAKLFEQYGCVTCHVLDSQGRCPTLRYVFGHPVVLDDGRTVMADEAYIRESILNPNAKIVKGYHRDIMPVFQGQIGEDGLLQLVAFIKSLAPKTPGAPASAARGAAQPGVSKQGAAKQAQKQ